MLAEATTAARTLSHNDLVYEAWRRGRLRWLLHSDQKLVYDQYRTWEQLSPSVQPGMFKRLFLLDIGKRWGKTTKRFVVRVEDCIRNPGSSYRYASAFQKNIEEIVDEVAQRIFESCPKPLRPRYRQGGKADGDNDPRRAGTGFYFPECDGKVSVLKLVGLDKDPDGLRGRASDGDDISEAAFVRHLRYSVKNVLYHQYQGRPQARMCMESSAPREADSEYDMVFVEDAKLRQAYAYRTIDDNPMLSAEEREEFITAAGGRDHPDCQIEYFNKRVRDPKIVVIPEFLAAEHVRASETPDFAHCYVALDPGMRDLCALVWAHWDAERGKLVIVRDWAERNAGTKTVADTIVAVEAELWPSLHYYDGKDVRANPCKRVSDTDLRLIYDLRVDHGIQFLPTAKDDKQAALYALRNAFRSGQIEIRPECRKLIAHLNAARWNEQRTDYERSEVHGHYDLVDALVYLWRNVDRNANPKPPEDFGVRGPSIWASPKAPPSHVPEQYRDMAAAWSGFRAGAR